MVSDTTTRTTTTTEDQHHHHDTPRTNHPRVVSLLPSITEVVACLGGADHIVGITHECDHPPAVMKNQPQVVTTSDISPYTMTQAEIHEAVCGSLKNGHSLYGLRADVLKGVQPDIVFTQSLCDVCAVSYPVVKATCAKLVAAGRSTTTKDDDNELVGKVSSEENGFNPKIISLEPSNLKDVFTTLRVAGDAMGPSFAERAEEQITNLQADLDKICQVTKSLRTKEPQVAFLEWHAPIFCGGHWIADMMEIAGARYDMCESGKRSFALTDEDFATLDPDYILIGPCGFSLEQSMKDTKTLLYGVASTTEGEDAASDEEKAKQQQRVTWWKSLRAVKEGNVFCLDGNGYYARPGPRLVQGAGIIAACIHGEEVAKALGERLAPSQAYHRVTEDDLRGS